MLGLDRCYPRPRRKDCDPSGVDILFGLPSGGVAGAQPPANGLNPFGVPLLPQRFVYNDESSSLGMQPLKLQLPRRTVNGQAGACKAKGSQAGAWEPAKGTLPTLLHGFIARVRVDLRVRLPHSHGKYRTAARYVSENLLVR